MRTATLRYHSSRQVWRSVSASRTAWHARPGCGFFPKWLLHGHRELIHVEIELPVPAGAVTTVAVGNLPASRGLVLSVTVGESCTRAVRWRPFRAIFHWVRDVNGARITFEVDVVGLTGSEGVGRSEIAARILRTASKRTGRNVAVVNRGTGSSFEMRVQFRAPRTQGQAHGHTAYADIVAGHGEHLANGIASADVTRIGGLADLVIPEALRTAALVNEAHDRLVDVS